MSDIIDILQNKFNNRWIDYYKNYVEYEIIFINVVKELFELLHFCFGILILFAAYKNASVPNVSGNIGILSNDFLFFCFLDFK